MSDKYLKTYQYYSDLYDRGTVERCRRTERLWKGDTESSKDKKLKKKQIEAIKVYGLHLNLRCETGERYLNKPSTIREWMDADRAKDDLYESAEAPEDIRCLTCRNRLKPTFKELWSESDKPDRVLFMYDCPNKCMPRRAFFSDGEEWRVKPNLCPHCSTSLEYSSNDNGKIHVTTYTCSKCSYTKSDEYEWSHKEDDIDEEFPKDRDSFCLTQEEGQKYQEEKWNMQQLGKLMEEWKTEQNAREEKLKENPKGFHLEGVGYNCAICGESTPEGDNWYDKWGIKCLVCQKAIDKGEIPASVAKDKDSWYTKYDLESDFNIKAPTLRKWVKEGIIKARTVSHYGTGVHYQLFLIKDNKDFLPPKEMVKSRMIDEVKDGKTWSRLHPWYHFVDPRIHLKDYKIMDYLKVATAEERGEEK